MPIPAPPRALVDNQLLAALLRVERQRLLPHLEWVRLAQNKILYETGDIVRHIYFPVGGMTSLLSSTEDGQTVEVAMVGNEGAVGISAILGVERTPYKAKVQLPANAIKPLRNPPLDLGPRSRRSRCDRDAESRV